MRERDAREIYATCWDENPEHLADRVVAGGSFRFVFAVDGVPACVVGAAPLWPNVWAAFMFATDDWPRVAVSVTRFVRRVMIPVLFEQGVIRVSAASDSAHDTAHRWLELLGAEREGSPLLDFGKDGETFFNYVWRRPHVAKMLKRDK